MVSEDLFKKYIRIGSDLLLNLSLAGGQLLKVYKSLTQRASVLKTFKVFAIISLSELKNT